METLPDIKSYSERGSYESEPLVYYNLFDSSKDDYLSFWMDGDNI